MRRLDTGGFTRLVEAVDKPLGFYVLALLIVEGFLTIVLTLSDLNASAKAWGMASIIGLFVMVVLLVSILVRFKPTSLTFTGFETLVSIGRASYGTDAAEKDKARLPSGTSESEL